MVTKQLNSTRMNHDSSLGWLRGLVTWFFVVLAGLTFAAFVVVHWVEQQILSTDNWVAMVEPLPKQAVVSDALGRNIAAQIIDEPALEARIAEALPPRGSFLAGPLTDQLKGLTVRIAQRIVSSDAFQTIWTGANRAAMNRLLATARGQETPLEARVNERFNIDITDIGSRLGSGLGRVAEAVPALQPASQKALAISTDLHAQPRRIRQVVRTTDNLVAVLPLAIMASTLLALSASRNRRMTVIWIAVGSLIFLLVELIALKWLKDYMLGRVRIPDNLSAIEYIFDTLTSSLKNLLISAAIATIVVVLICWAAGPSGPARRLRSATRLDKLRQSSLFQSWPPARLWLNKQKYYIWLTIGVVVLVGLAAFATVTSMAIINAVLLAISLIALVHILSSPPKSAAHD